jgi:ribosomal protein S18 acetylase RimI-like enzyme
MRVTISNLREKEVNEFYKLFKKTLKQDFPEYSKQVREIQLNREFTKKDFLKMVGKKDEVVIVAREKRKIIGFVVLGKETGGVVEIIWLGVKRGYRNSGIGSRLLSATDKWATEHKCHCLTVCTENKRNVAFYLKRGYDYVGMQKEAWYGVNEYLLQKNICKPFRSIFKI